MVKYLLLEATGPNLVPRTHIKMRGGYDGAHLTISDGEKETVGLLASKPRLLKGDLDQ